MKKIFSVLFLTTFLFAACSDGDRGPEGPQGPPGEDGVNILGQTFEYEDVDFDYLADGNVYSTIVDVPAEVAVEVSDAILVYRLEIAQNNDGEDIETWSLVPQNFFLDQGTIQYVYNHTDIDVELLIDGNFDLSTLGDEWTQNQVFRFVVVPSDFAENTGVDVANMQAVMNAINIEPGDVQQVNQPLQ